ncbi:tRNA 2-thiouridine(34) synthase MnmA [bacterium]|nr:tRNA 2-thiouridine(34) synthase MnmA [bacterium]
MPENRVAVALSGGVDSSVAACLLKERGFDLVGLTMRLAGPERSNRSDRDAEDAAKTAGMLGIPHFVINLHEPFRENVINYFVSEYEKGRTPNPCAMCNPLIKFGVLFEQARALGADILATGHYAAIVRDEKTGRMLLKRAREKSKDQSYFLARLSQEALSKTLFPVGPYYKKKIRQMAGRFGLPVTEKPESQETCFVPEAGVAPFIESEKGRAGEPGPMLDAEGRELGTHKGLFAYTIGQRKGLGIALGKPAYVIRIDADQNAIVIGGEDSLYHSKFIASKPNWISMENPPGAFRAGVQIRYKHRPAQALVTPKEDGNLEITYARPQRAITPGQLAVFYDKDIVIGSAWIDRVVE